LLVNSNVYTADDSNPRAEAVLAVDGRIAFVGTRAEALRRAPHGTRRADLHGLTVVPGITDSHAHVAGIGFRELGFNLEGTSGLTELKDRLRARAKQGKPCEWLTGRGWIESHWTPATFPTRTDLDAVVSDRPVSLERTDGHAMVVNSSALTLAKIDRDTPDPARRSHSKGCGHRTADRDVDRQRDGFGPALDSIADGSGDREGTGGGRTTQRATWLDAAADRWQLFPRGRSSLQALHRITLRLYDAIYGPSADVQRLLTEGPSINRCGGKLTVRGIKLYIDGADSDAAGSFGGARRGCDRAL